MRYIECETMEIRIRLSSNMEIRNTAITSFHRAHAQWTVCRQSYESFLPNAICWILFVVLSCTWKMCVMSIENP